MTDTLTPEKRRWNKAWYEPFDDIDKVALGLRFTLHLPVTAMLTPGHWDLFKMALDLAQAGALTPLNDNERKLVPDPFESVEQMAPTGAINSTARDLVRWIRMLLDGGESDILRPSWLSL